MKPDVKAQAERFRSKATAKGSSSALVNRFPFHLFALIVFSWLQPLQSPWTRPHLS